MGGKFGDGDGTGELIARLREEIRMLREYKEVDQDLSSPFVARLLAENTRLVAELRQLRLGILEIGDIVRQHVLDHGRAMGNGRRG